MPRAVAALVLSALFLGCAATVDEGELVSSASSRLTQLSPVGTFRASGVGPGVYESITFLENGTYRASAVASCTTEDCAMRTTVAIEGTWASNTHGRLTLRPRDITRPPLFDTDGGGAYLVVHEAAHAQLNTKDEYSEPGLEADRLPTPGIPVRGGPTYPLDRFAGGCTTDSACANTVCEEGTPQCTAFGTCGCAAAVVVEAN